MHEQPIHHLYTNKKLKLSVTTSNGLRFVCSPNSDSQVRRLQQLILEKYNEFIGDPTHRYYQAHPKAKGVYNIRLKCYYLSPSDYVVDVLNDFDEIECDVDEVHTASEASKKRDLKKAKAIEHEIPEEGQSNLSESNTTNPLGQRRQRRKKKENGEHAQPTGQYTASHFIQYLSPRQQPVPHYLSNVSGNGKHPEAQTKKMADASQMRKDSFKSTDKPEQPKPHSTKTSMIEIPQLELHATEPPKLQQSRASEQKSDRSMSSPQVRPAIPMRVVHNNSNISKEDSSLRLESDRSHDSSTFKAPKPAKQSSVGRTPEIEPMKTPPIKPMPSLNRQSEQKQKPQSKPQKNPSGQLPAKKSQDLCVLVVAESDNQQELHAQTSQPQKSKPVPVQKSIKQKPTQQASKASESARDKKIDKYLSKEFAQLAKSSSSIEDD